ncbi:unnamed protein product [Lampetra planeri]
MFPDDIINLHVDYCLENNDEAQQHVPRTDVPNLESSPNQHSQDESMERPEDETDDHSEDKEEQDTKSEDTEEKHLEEAASEQVKGQDEDGEGIPCPLCQYRFPEDVLQDHAEMCGEHADVISRFINSEPYNCPICNEAFPIPQLLEHAQVCDGWRNKEEGKAKSKDYYKIALTAVKKALLLWLIFLVAICGVVYLAYLSYTKFREWRQARNKS